MKVAAHVLCSDKVGKFPLKGLIQQCHHVISNNESILFDQSKDTRVNLDASEAIRQLSRHDIIRVVYDPDGSLMDKAQRKELGLPPDDDFSVDQKEDIVLEEPSLGSKAKSCLPFGHLKAGAAADSDDEEMKEEKSQVFYKRDRLFSVLGSVQLDIAHAENLWMIEEKLKKIDTINKARDYKGMMHERNPLRGLLKAPEEAEELSNRFNQMADDEMQDLLDRISNRIDEMLDEASSQDQFEIMKPGFITTFTEEICEMAMSQSISDANLALFFDMLYLEMEEKIQEHEMGVAENEDAQMDLLRPEHIKTLVLVKIKAFGAMIRETREKATELYNQRKKDNPSAQQEEEKSAPKEDQPMKEEGEKLPEIMVKTKAVDEKKSDSAAANAN